MGLRARLVAVSPLSIIPNSPRTLKEAHSSAAETPFPHRFVEVDRAIMHFFEISYKRQRAGGASLWAAMAPPLLTRMARFRRCTS